METFLYPQFSVALSNVHIAFFAEVKNAAYIRHKIIKASVLEGEEGEAERAAVNFAFIDSRLVTSLLHLQTAVYQSMLSLEQKILKTKTVHSEILWWLNSTHNITESLKHFGVSDQTRSLILVRIGPPCNTASLEKELSGLVEGVPTPLSKIAEHTDWTAVKKHYKLAQDLKMCAVRSLSTENQLIDKITCSFVAMKQVQS